MSTEEQLDIAIAALKRIKSSDPGPAYYIAKEALEEIYMEVSHVNDQAGEPSTSENHV